MKKITFILLFLLVICLFGCNNESNDADKILDEALNKIAIDSEVESDLTLPTSIDVNGAAVSLSWQSNNEALDSSGKIKRGTNDISCILEVKATYKDKEKTKSFNVVIKKTIDLQRTLDTISIDEIVKSDIAIPKTVQYEELTINVSWEVQKITGEERAALDTNGHVVLPLEEDAEFVLVAKASLSDQATPVEKAFPVKLLSYKSICKEAAKKLNIPSTVNDDIALPTNIDDIDIQWYSSKEDILSSTGKCSYVTSAQNVKLSAGLSIDYDNDKTYYYDVDYKVQVTPYSFSKRVELAKDKLSFKDPVYGKANLPTDLDYDLKVTWSSSNKELISDEGLVLDSHEECAVTFEGTIEDKLDSNNTSKFAVELTIGACVDNDDELDFMFHNIIDYTSKYTRSHLTNLEFNNNGKVVLSSGATSGTYESRVFNTRKFKSLVGSWSCITSPNATIELEISVCVNGKWSKYFTYGVWGLGKDNYYYNQTDSSTNTKMSVDEIIINSGSATACKYRVTLRRNSATTDSPVLSLVCLALDISESDYSYPVDVSNLPKSVDNEIPKLYQYDVPGIGGSICSATTTTMLLKWKGYSFTNKGKAYEHEYIASLVADPGHNSPTYGNWSYNMAVAGAYGDNAYVARMYSWEEVMYHLATVGPMGASIRSSNGEWGYNTNGHLVIIRGYRINSDGSTIVICNDPAVKNVYYEVTLRQFLTCWRGVSYVMEK